MSYENWKNKAQGFQTVDVRHIQGSFFEGLKKRAEALEVGEGLHIIQTFEPHPLYAVMEGLGYEHHTEQRSEAEFHVWFCRVEKKEGDSSAPFKPLALLNYPMIDEKLGQIAVDFWETTWQSEKRVLPYETRLLLSLTNAVGAGRMRQAARELVKAYIHGVESAALDDVFELLAWNQGIGFFSSEIGPSALFQAYKLIKNGEKQGKSREDICSALREKFGGEEPGDAGLALKAETFTNGCAAAEERSPQPCSFWVWILSRVLSSCCPCLFAPIALFSANLRYISINPPVLNKDFNPFSLFLIKEL